MPVCHTRVYVFDLDVVTYTRHGISAGRLENVQHTYLSRKLSAGAATDT